MLSIRADKKMRFKVFQDNLRRIEILNRVDQGTAFYGLNKWADFTGKL